MFGLNFLGKMFGSEKAFNQIVSSVSSGLDSLVHTDQERAEAAQAERSEARKMIIEWMRSTEGQNLARRFLVVVVTSLWAAFYVASVVLSVFSVWATDPDRYLKTAALLQSNANEMSTPMMMILAFYFAAPHMRSFIDNFRHKDIKTGPSRD